jgi:hypothetical protein
MKKILAVTVSFFVLAVAGVFAQTDSTRVLEISDDFTEIKTLFQKRLFNASAEFKYFLHYDGPFDIENGYLIQLLNVKEREAIDKKKYFIFEATDTMTGSTPTGIHMYLLFLVNKEGQEAVSFAFINDWVKSATFCSKAEIKSALNLYFLESQGNEMYAK